MADIFSVKERSAIMQKVKSEGNLSTEIRLIGIFQALNIKGWRRNYPVKGKPDFVFLSKRVAVFVDGCFWHGHNCRNIVPKQNSEYWALKRQRNIERDKMINDHFENRGWKVIRFWECNIKTGKLDLQILL